MLTAIAAAFTTAITAVKTFVATVGPQITAMATKLIELAKTHLPQVAEFVQTIAQTMQLLPGDENIDDLGRKAKLSDKKPEDFDSTKAYIDHLRTQVQVEPEKIKAETEVDQYTNLAIGAVLVIKTLNETKGADIPMETWVALAKLGLNQPEANALIDSFKDSYDQLNAFLNGRQTPDQEIETGNKIADAYKTLYPELSHEDIESKVMQLELPEDKK